MEIRDCIESGILYLSSMNWALIWEMGLWGNIVEMKTPANITKIILNNDESCLPSHSFHPHYFVKSCFGLLVWYLESSEICFGSDCFFFLKLVLVCFGSNPLVGGSGAWNCCLPTVKLQMGLVANKIIRDKIENFRNTKIPTILKKTTTMKSLPKAQRTQCLECFDSFNISSSKSLWQLWQIKIFTRQDHISQVSHRGVSDSGTDKARQ